MRQQVMLVTSARFNAARSQLESTDGSTVDRSVRSLLFDNNSVGVHPMMRHVAAGVRVCMCRVCVCVFLCVCVSLHKRVCIWVCVFG